jgi:hypothetical protein
MTGMGTVVAFRRFVEVRERHRQRAVERRRAESPMPAPGAPAIEGELVPPPGTPPYGVSGRLPLGRRGPTRTGPRSTAGG